MGYDLNFISLSWQTLQSKLRHPSSDVSTIVFESQWKRYQGSNASEISWNNALWELSSASSPRQTMEFVHPSEDAALALVCLVNHFGKLLGSLNHASSSGMQFTADFLGDVAAKAFAEPAFAKKLTSRPLFGLLAADFPAWGGLQIDEIRRFTSAYRKPAYTDEDVEGWLDNLAILLQSAAAAGSDLITLYL